MEEEQQVVISDEWAFEGADLPPSTASFVMHVVQKNVSLADGGGSVILEDASGARLLGAVLNPPGATFRLAPLRLMSGGDNPGWKTGPPNGSGGVDGGPGQHGTPDVTVLIVDTPLRSGRVAVGFGLAAPTLHGLRGSVRPMVEWAVHGILN
jgi:hypothetical protein